MICTSLQDVMRYQLSMRKGREKIKAIDGVMKVERVRCKDGSTARFPTEKQINKYDQLEGQHCEIISMCVASV